MSPILEQPPPALDEGRNSSIFAVDFQGRWLLFGFRLLAIALGALHTWAAVKSYSMNEDGIAYLDIGDAYMRGEWQTAVSSVWSPLYPFLLGLALNVLKPSMRWEFPMVHLLNFVIYVIAFVCFEFFWRQLRRCRDNRITDASDAQVKLPEWAFEAFGYSLFIWSSLGLIEIWAVTPDMLMAALVYLAAGLLMRIRLGAGWNAFVWLGVVLGLGYLTKTIMFPVALAFLGISLFSVPNPQRAIRPILLSLVIFLVLSAPFIAVISLAKDHFTLGDAGKLTYVRYVNGVRYPHWQGDPPGNGTPKHPSRKILDSPPIYEFGTPIGGTYPISRDPSYWYEGVVVRFDFWQQLRLLMSSALFYLDLFGHRQAGLLVGVVILYLMMRWQPLGPMDVLRDWGLVILALLVLGAYGLVYVEGRYVGVFVVLLWSDLLAGVRLPDSQTSRKWVSCVSLAMVLFMLAEIVSFNLEGAGALARRSDAIQQAKGKDSASWPGEVAEELQKVGIRPGDKVAIIGDAFVAFWARLARVQIVAEMFGWEADPFWLGDSETQQSVIRAFTSSGARAIVADSVPDRTSLAGWRRLGSTGHFVYLLGP